mmetsp:Transcript_54323/g.79691  ORF Transcript_54323/g.79691 Transcript_54323/m.79691 type:complete len:204 (-) Transcript_54323:896-1507(-)
MWGVSLVTLSQSCLCAGIRLPPTPPSSVATHTLTQSAASPGSLVRTTRTACALPFARATPCCPTSTLCSTRRIHAGCPSCGPCGWSSRPTTRRSISTTPSCWVQRSWSSPWCTHRSTASMSTSPATLRQCGIPSRVVSQAPSRRVSRASGAASPAEMTTARLYLCREAACTPLRQPLTRVCRYSSAGAPSCLRASVPVAARLQ